MLTKQESLAYIEALGLRPGDTIYTLLRHRSGESRRISMVYVNNNRQPVVLDHLAEGLGVAKRKRVTRYDINGKPYSDITEGLAVSGSGMDMGFELVYRFGRAVAEAQGAPDRPDPGYSFKHQWI